MAPVSASVLQAFTGKVLHRKYCIDACTSRRYCIVSQKEVLFNIPCGVDEELEGAASIELGGAALMPAPPVGGADAVDMGGGGALGWYLHSAATSSTLSDIVDGLFRHMLSSQGNLQRFMGFQC